MAASTEDGDGCSSLEKQGVHTAAMSIDSTCEASTLSGGTLCNASMVPLLKASPPTPVGRVAGRYKVYLWRLSTAQPYGISFGKSNLGMVIVAEDAPHIGIRSGDEVLSLNRQAVADVWQCSQVLATARDLELLMYHREDDSLAEHGQTPLCGQCLSPRDAPPCCEPCLNPPEPRCRARCFPLRDLLQTTGPIPLDIGGSFAMQIVRVSRKQPFGLVLAVTPQSGDGKSGPLEPLVASDSDYDDEGGLGESEPVVMFIKEHLPHLGLLEGDELVQINGMPANSVEVCRLALRTSMTLSLEFRRHHGHLVKRLDEVSIAGASSAKDIYEQADQDWFPDAWRRFCARFCCWANGVERKGNAQVCVEA
mmetsp:Transcript_19043/g.44771  ORF Transcript_19043/g.44771 Transcript_19043/m.44771 type:complete len:365 (+) Transcript_19043:115-1209(+)|eukprot:CAMPEP_0171111606 /NCGR_PEP_ID=MMETSP0766_2-20121228/75738_1 /TAXON_ID=439317 /ORGANISM="Gambierdiscus australes, Strain CAWD 149" /LENGTH=364 /DNA_ID=CAMNT_0011573611 /DNA_START=12 /DNA_END=1106 /DNA_ORIENTATION=+